MSLLDSPKMRLAIAKAQSIMQRHGLNTGGCKTTGQLADAMDKALPSSMASQGRALLEDRQALTALMYRFTGDKDIGKKLDAIYEPRKNNSAAHRRGRSKK